MHIPSTSCSPAIPGQRISDCGIPNVATIGVAGPLVWRRLPVRGRIANSNIIVIVCADGDAGLLRPAERSPDVPATLVLLTTAVGRRQWRKGILSGRAADLFMTTSDADDVGELVANLAS
jgi:hypothetical protein